MTITRNLMGVGLPASAASVITGTVADDLTSTGTNQATALLISNDTSIFYTVPSGSGCILPMGSKNDEYLIINDSATTLNIYPPVGGTVGGGAANTPFALPSLQNIIFKYQDDRTINNVGGIGNLSNSTGSALVGFIQAGAGAVARTVQEKLRETVSVADFGATGDGVTNDRSAFVNADAVGLQVEVPSGDYLISSSLALTNKIIMQEGAKFIIPTGVTLTLNGEFVSDIQQCFSISGTGSVVFSPVTNSTGYPEWWGATTGGADCVTAIESCFVALPKTILQGGDYFISRCLQLNTEHRTIEGSNVFYEVSGDSTTRVLVTSGSENVIQVGPSALPGSGINTFTQEIKLINLQVGRSIAPVISSNCVGILNKYTLRCSFVNVRSVESMRGFEFSGTVRTLVRDCYSFRSSAGTGGGTDLWYGFYVNGTPEIAAGGGNASIYIEDCNASQGGVTIAGACGLYIDQNFSDTYISKFEVTTCSYGIRVVGNNTATVNYGNIDFFISDCVVDQFNIAGISLENIEIYGALDIRSTYSAAANVGTVVAGINISSCKSSMTISGSQVIAGANTACLGMKVVDSKNIISSQNAFHDCSIAISLSTVSFSSFNDIITNKTNAATQGVKLITTCSSNSIYCDVTGSAAKISVGVDLSDATSTYNEINATRIDAAALVGGEANKVKMNSVQITNAGQTGTNLVSGINNTSLVWQYPQLVCPLIVGGTSTTQTLTYKTTSGIGATGANHEFKVGNNGSLTPFKILNSGVSQFFPDGSTLLVQLDTTGVSAGGFGSNGGLFNARSNSNRFSGVFQYCAADTNGTTLTFLRNRGTVSASTSLSSGDILAELNCITWDGTANRNSSAIITYADAAHGAGSVPGRISFFTTPDASTTRTEGMRLSRNQRLHVGGGVDPTAKVHIAAGSATAGTAPIKLTSGTNLTTPEAGAVEFDGTNYFVTSSSTRYAIAKTLTSTATLNFPSTVAGASADLTIAVPGAADGDVVALGVPNASTNVNTLFTAFVSAADTVTVRFQNANLVTTVDPASGTFRVSVLKY